MHDVPPPTRFYVLGPQSGVALPETVMLNHSIALGPKEQRKRLSAATSPSALGKRDIQIESPTLMFRERPQSWNSDRKFHSLLTDLSPYCCNRCKVKTDIRTSFWVYIGIMEKKMETTVMWFRV